MVMMILKSLFPLNRSDVSKLSSLKDVLAQEELRELKSYLKFHKARFDYKSFNTSKEFFEDSRYLVISPNVVDPHVRSRIEEMNEKVLKHGKEEVFKKFSDVAPERILSIAAPEVIGHEYLKQAAMLQLFSSEQIHVLLFGDKNCGKTTLLNNIMGIAPKSSKGSGKGSDNAGLTLRIIGGQAVKGVLPSANGGVAYIDELNQLQTIDRAGLIMAMDSGVIKHDKGKTPIKLDAHANVFATADPENDEFVGKTLSVLKQQVNLDSAIFNRFHLVFFLRKQNQEKLRKINEKIRDLKNDLTDEDRSFVKEYISYSLTREVEFDKNLSSMIKGFVDDIKTDQDKFLIEVSPRLVFGIMNLSKALARSKLKPKVEKKDLLTILKIFDHALYLKPN